MFGSMKRELTVGYSLSDSVCRTAASNKPRNGKQTEKAEILIVSVFLTQGQGLGLGNESPLLLIILE